MVRSWRLFKELSRSLSTAEGLAIDDTLPQSVANHQSPPILHLYTFVPSVIVGKYQDIEAALKLDRCRARGVEFNRRSTGGGTVIMGPRILALGLGIDVDYPGLKKGVGGVFESLSRVLANAVGSFDVPAYFKPKNDLEVGGRKVAGLSAAADAGKSLLFHTSLLVDFDVELMVDIMNTPLIKLQDKGYNCFSQRMTTLAHESGSDLSMAEVMRAVENAFEEEFGINFRQDEPDSWEKETIDRFIEERYTQDDWIFSHKHPRVRMGVGQMKTPGGLLEVYLSLSGAAIEQVLITGDFFSTSADIKRLEDALKWSSARPDAIQEKLTEVWRDDMIHGIDLPTLTTAILKAKENQVRL
ncbi:lipoate--protein ligase [Desulfatiglans anilini]|uniref:lipoate--protein ligase n=1 Tax=Desulfatiglans anilini TaxID=90728 RepID=UPI000488B548|nr:lipoate--protein ligase [Desulfatiglans anilini]